MMKRHLFLIPCSLFLLSGCDTPDDFMKCGEYEVKTEIHEDSMTATINGDMVELKHMVSASGAQYEGTLNDVSVVLWNRGDDWTLILGNDSPIECK